jgi:hypothetical protein
MTRYSIAFVFLAILSPTMSLVEAEDKVQLPSGKEVMAKCLQASGGKDRLAAVKSLTIKGSAEVPEFGLKGAITIHYRGGQVRVESDFAGQTTLQGINNGKGWELAPTGARLMSDVETRELLSSVSMSQLTEPEKIYKSIETVGKKEVDGQACYHLKMAHKLDEGVEELFVSVESGLPLQAITDKQTQLGKVQVVTTLSDYKVVDGIKSATTTSSRLEKLGMTYKATFDSVQYNKPIDDSVFEIPEQVKPLLQQ